MSDDGVTGAYRGDHFAIKIIIATFIGISWYNALELCVLVFVTFSHYRGLYFWSLLISATVGVIPYALGFLLKLFHLMDTVWLSLVFLTIGWWTMVTGQSFVLYSRLHLVIRDQKILRRVLWMIICNIFILHLPTTILTFGSNSSHQLRFVPAYKIMEKIQMTGFFIQEVILSTLYIRETTKMLRIAPKHGSRKIMYQLLGINLIFIVMDLALLSTAYANLYVIETTIKAMIYSVKLKLEFAVLGKLVHLVNIHSWNPEFFSGANGYPDFVDPTQITSDITRPPKCINSPPNPPWSFPDALPIMSDPQLGRKEDVAPSSSGSLATTQLAPSTPNGIPMPVPVDVTHAIPSQIMSPKILPAWPS
ncbi:uncharacterized protein GIQ15_01107 [Arthroderma uncinatum]|uniref:uncharacterized protein n=1 Tax=Arthroderma uncinatum TaxID=74035 RepID=UPI00144ACC6A|nr:uncharacterized protein GIQ15_01107 [Arthroderma uncinatum]KAF3491590.1 integral membrane protein [Arthroderma uncinatum]